MFLLPDSVYNIKKVPDKGRGVFAARDIEAGTVIGDYLGKIIKSGTADESRDGLYDMAGGKKYDILANPKVKGVHFINHSCANNCDVYPYQGHMLFFALRKIFKNEELSLNYWLYAPDEKNTICANHACYCESEICTGTMHHAAANFDLWERFIKKQFGAAYNKLPGKYGQQLSPLTSYPTFINIGNKGNYDYDIFASEITSAAKNNDSRLPNLSELKSRIRETGQRQAFPKMHFEVFGIQNKILLGKRI
jgi:hypothetical protein